ncbi:hypothetical protein BDF14DRAFT_1869768 [Spinellus fusiger]|nr:hypothetical protein BDF14DRAFT_1869768 [Spinellus fusiger]
MKRNIVFFGNDIFHISKFGDILANHGHLVSNFHQFFFFTVFLRCKYDTCNSNFFMCNS